MTKPQPTPIPTDSPPDTALQFEQLRTTPEQPGIPLRPSGSSGGSYDRGMPIEQEIVKRLEAIREHRAAGKLGDDPPDPCPKYRLIGPIGSGTYGSVWEAEKLDTPGEVVAIKFFSRGSRGAARGEMEVLKKFDSQEGFIQIIDRHQPPASADAWPFYVMKRASGSVGDRLFDAKGQPQALPRKTVMAWFERIVRAVANAHAKKPGICHCDLKPSNLLLVEEEPLVSDFGQARFIEVDGEGSRGTPFYMPREQAEHDNHSPDARWDVYALGAILYTLLHPQHLEPWRDGWDDVPADEKTRLQRGHLKRYRDHLEKYSKPPARIKLRPLGKLDKPLVEILRKCLSFEPEERYRDAGTLLEALQQRERKLRRAPMIHIGAMSTAATFLLAVGSAIGFQMFVAEETQTALVNTARQQQKELAHLTGRLLEEKLQRRAHFVQESTRAFENNADLMTSLNQARALYQQRDHLPVANRWFQDDRASIRDWLSEQTRHADSQGLFSRRGMALAVHMNGFGYLFAQTVPGAAKGSLANLEPWKNADTLDRMSKNYSWRDWFSGAGYLNADTDITKPHPPITTPAISIIYLGNRDTRLMLDSVAPIFTASPVREVAAVIKGGTDFQDELGGWISQARQSGPTQVRNKTQVIILNDRNIVIWRDEMSDLMKDIEEAWEVSRSKKNLSSSVLTAAGGRQAATTENLQAELILRKSFEDRLDDELDLILNEYNPDHPHPLANAHSGNITVWFDEWYRRRDSFRESMKLTTLTPASDQEKARDNATRHSQVVVEEFQPLPGVAPGKPWKILVIQDEKDIIAPEQELSKKLRFIGIAAFMVFTTLTAAVWWWVWRSW